jgi:cytochrome c oxidase cbb3-type subunit III
MMRYARILLVLLVITACEREARRFRDENSTLTANPAERMSDLVPGAPVPDRVVPTFYEDNAYATAQGKRLFEYFNCVGCHAHGGGGMGPALMDDRWIYGSDPENIFATIVEGRPNGMPSFGGRIPEDRIWWIVAYVRSLSGQTPKGARPSRDDNMQYQRPQQRLRGKETPRQATPPRP